MAIFSNLEIEEEKFQREGNKTRAVTVKVTVDPTLEPVYVTALHLDHRLDIRPRNMMIIESIAYRVEPNRMREVRAMEKSLQSLFTEQSHQIWTGDFNCLTREDYDDKTWGDIARVR